MEVVKFPFYLKNVDILLERVYWWFLDFWDEEYIGSLQGSTVCVFMSCRRWNDHSHRYPNGQCFLLGCSLVVI